MGWIEIKSTGAEPAFNAGDVFKAG